MQKTTVPWRLSESLQRPGSELLNKLQAPCSADSFKFFFIQCFFSPLRAKYLYLKRKVSRDCMRSPLSGHATGGQLTLLLYVYYIYSSISKMNPIRSRFTNLVPPSVLHFLPNMYWRTVYVFSLQALFKPSQEASQVGGTYKLLPYSQLTCNAWFHMAWG